MKGYLGEFEELVLMVVAILREDAYGNNIAEEIKNKTGRKVNLSAVHVTLYRMEDKDLLKSEMGGATSERGGRRKRIFKITNTGLEILQNNYNQRMSLYKLIPEFKFSI